MREREKLYKELSRITEKIEKIDPRFTQEEMEELSKIISSASQSPEYAKQVMTFPIRDYLRRYCEFDVTVNYGGHENRQQISFTEEMLSNFEECAGDKIPQKVVDIAQSRIKESENIEKELIQTYAKGIRNIPLSLLERIYDYVHEAYIGFWLATAPLYSTIKIRKSQKEVMEDILNGDINNRRKMIYEDRKMIGSCIIAQYLYLKKSLSG